MTIDEVRKAKKEAEDQILSIVQELSSKTKVGVDRINLEPHPTWGVGDTYPDWVYLVNLEMKL